MYGSIGIDAAQPPARRFARWVFAGACAVGAPFAAAQTCVAPTVLHPDGGSISGDTCSGGESSVVLCNGAGKSGPAVIYSINATHLSGWIDGATSGFSMFLAVKNSNCLTGDCISTQPGSPILFTPDMTGPFLVVVTADPTLDAGSTCGTYTLFPNLHVIDDLLLADGFDRPAVPSADVRN